jgi:heterodisulfide reductase subunit A
MTDTILIVGGGVAGLHAAIKCSEAGAQCIVIERGPVVGGRLAATMLEPSAIGNRSEGVRTPLFEALVDHPNIQIMTQAELENLEGRPGNFTATIREQGRFVTDACTRCKNCHTVCPVVLPNEADAGLTFRKAIYTPMADTLPAEWVIDIDNCLNTPPNYLPCQRCVDVCDDNAIFFDRPLSSVHEKQVGSVILAPGFRTEDSGRFAELGYGKHPDVVTSAELQRLLESPGPTGGFASKPSNEEYPDSVLLVLDNPSQFALYIVASQVHQLLDQDVETVAVLLLSQPSDESQKSDVRKLADSAGIEVFWGAMFSLDPAPDSTLKVSFEDFSANRLRKDSYDLVVLCADVEPPEGISALAETAGVELTAQGYISGNGKDTVSQAGEKSNGSAVDPVIGTSRPGVFVAGCASGPKNIKDSLAEAEAAADSAAAQLDPRVLQSGESEKTEGTVTESAAQASPNDMRQQLEQLLYALIDR